MVLDLYDQIRGFKSEIPNNFTVAMGERIRSARNEANLTQGQLAEKAYLRQATISDMEKGKREPSVSELLSISFVLSKPLAYFFPKGQAYVIDETSLSKLEQELILNARNLSESDLKKIIAQIKAIISL
jgi:transcriptional regulator with XRE-family HTH domain